MPDVYARTLRRAGEIVGVKELAERLNVPLDDLWMWTQGLKRTPQDVFLKAVDIVVAHQAEEVSNPNIKLPRKQD